MAAIPITFLTSIESVNPSTDPMVIVDISDTTQSPSGTTKKVLANQIIAANLNGSFGNLSVVGNETVAGSFAVGGNKLYVGTANGAIGVGTTSPTLSGNFGVHVYNQSGSSEIKAESSNSNFSIQALNGSVNLTSTTAATVSFVTNGNTKFAVYSDGRTAFADYLQSSLFPVISNLFDQNTGIFFPDDDQVAITTGGIERLRVDDVGSVSTSDDLLVGGSARVDSLTGSQVVFTNGTKYLETKTASDARTALQTTTYTHVQGVAANPWIINHNLNAFPTVWVIDPLNRAGWAEVEYVDSNTCKVYLSGAQTGTAYLNF